MGCACGMGEDQAALGSRELGLLAVVAGAGMVLDGVVPWWLGQRIGELAGGLGDQGSSAAGIPNPQNCRCNTRERDY